MNAVDRRTVMAAMAAAAATGLSQATAQPAGRYPLGVQFFTFSSYAGQGWDKFSEAMSIARSIGYEGIEFAGVFGHSPDMIRRRAEELGLKTRSYHLGNDIVRAFSAPGPGGIADAQDATYTPIGVVQVCRATLGVARDLGAEWAGLGAIGRSNFTSIDAVRRMAEAFNTCGELAQKAGMKFFYHNHAIDFKPINGRVPFDILIEETNSNVRFEFDTGWAGTEGADPLVTLAKHADRIDLVHLRDSTAAGATAVPGDGVIDFARVMGAIQKMPKAPVFYMEGNGRPQLEAVAEATRAYGYLRRLGWGARAA